MPAEEENSRTMKKEEKVDVLKKLRDIITVHWESLGLPTADDKPVYNELKKLIDLADGLVSAKKKQSGNFSWIEKKQDLFNVEFEIPKQTPRQKTISSTENILEDSPMVSIFSSFQIYIHKIY